MCCKWWVQEDAGEAFHAAGGVAGKEDVPVAGVVMGGGHGLIAHTTPAAVHHHENTEDDKGDDDMDGDGDDE